MTNQELLKQYGPRESMEYDVVIVGAGPAGLSAAIKLKQNAIKAGKEISVVVLEKGSEAGAHILSGAVMDTRAITELIPDWREKGAPINQAVTEDAYVFLGKNSGVRVPNFLLPQFAQNHGNYIISLGNVVRWLAEQAEALGVEIFAGFAAAEIVYSEDGQTVKGVATGNSGIGKNGEPTEEFQLGMELHGKYTIFAEGSRGHLGKQLIEKYKLDKDSDPQSYGIGIKEIWEIDPAKHQAGFVMHTAGWPMNNETYGGAFLYHAEDNKIYCGYVVGLNYKNPNLSPFEEFQRWKTHPNIKWYFTDSKGKVNAKRISYGARAITAGGLLALPKTIVKGGVLIGCDAGYLNVSRIKGSHAAIKSGMLAADAIYNAVEQGRAGDLVEEYPENFKQSWLYDELYKDRNFKNWFKHGLVNAALMNGFEQKILGGEAPWTLRREKQDHTYIKSAKKSENITYSKPDGKLTFDRLSSVFLSGTNHSENQPSHLTLKNQQTPVKINLAEYAGLESRYCPAGVYEFVGENEKQLQINAQNCLHCKTCDIKDPTQNIVWLPPEGGGGPNYSGM